MNVVHPPPDAHCAIPRNYHRGHLVTVPNPIPKTVTGRVGEANVSKKLSIFVQVYRKSVFEKRRDFRREINVPSDVA